MISIEKISETDVFKSLDPFMQKLVLKRQNREVISNAINVYKNTGKLPVSIGDKNTKIAKELIHKQEIEEPKI